MDDSRLARISADATSVLATIESDHVLHDAALLQVVESLDRRKVRGYIYKGDATFLAQERASESGDAEGPVCFSRATG